MTELNIRMGLTEEESKQVFNATFPELAHLTESSTREEREEARRKLNVRLGLPANSGFPPRYRIIGDDSGHKYFVKVEDVENFHAWCDSFNENVGYEGPDFNENRIDGRFTFTDPRCE